MSDELAGLRAARAAARDEVGRAAGRLAAARATLRAAAAAQPPADVRERLASEHERALAALRDARAAEAGLRGRLSDAVAALPEGPIERIGQLDAGVPVAFLPMRIETRFRRAGTPGQPAAGELLVRVYPDALMADDHEPLLTAREVAAGQDYWRRVAADGGERDTWTALLAETTAERAAWIVEVTTPADPGAPDPVFPELQTRPDGWHRAPEARGLPERWIVTALRGDRRLQAVSDPVREGLALTPRMAGDDEDGAEGGGTVDLSGDGLAVEPELAWVYDFDEAERAGMAVRLPLTDADLADGFDTVLVVGVRTGEDADTQATTLERLLDAHRHSRGLAFVPQGTPTNNTGEQPSGYPPADLAGAVSFAVARGVPLATPGGDGARFAAALGVATATVDHVQGAGRDEQTPSAAMADALWPATIGYFLDQLMAPQVPRATVDELRDWLRDWVRPRGPLPAFRVGAIPYGVLPVGSLADWEPDATGAEGVPAGLPDFLGRLAGLWAAASGEPPHLGRSGDPDRDLIEVLGMDASTQTVKVRKALGFDTAWNVFSFAGIDLDGWDQTQQRVAVAVLDALGRRPEDFDPRALYLSYARDAHDFAGPLVADELSDRDPLPFDYVAWLRTASIAKLRDQAAPPAERPVTALLYLMLRHALLAEYDRTARWLLDGTGRLFAHEHREPELLEILPDPDVPGPRPPRMRTAWERFELNLPDLTGDGTLGALLTDQLGPPETLPHAALAVLRRLARFRASFRALEGMPTAELHRLFTETLDACSHRLDAWVTSLATRRLAAMRATTPRGVWLGAYGWAHDLRPDPPEATVDVTLGDGTTGSARTDSDGYTIAPSMLHAATAAVLRSGYLARSGPAREQYSVDLSSRRVRAALDLLDAVREDQPLGAVLGYRFERGLHEGHPGVELDRFIDDFRNLYPAVAGKTEAPGAPAEQVAARTVVDGLRLLTAWRAGGVPFGTGGLDPDATQRDAIEDELARLDDAVDALGDLLLAESVHQVVKGSPAGAAATLESLAQGRRPPEPEVVIAPRGGTVLHQRIALLVGGAAPPGWGPVPLTPRAAAAPELDAWLGRLLGDPAQIACQATPDGGAPRAVTLAELGLRSVDVLLLAQAAESAAGQAELDHRVAWQVAGPAGPDRPVGVDYETAPGTGRISFAVALEVAAAAGRLLGFGRPLTAADLLPPERAGMAGDPLDAELTGRVAAARAAVESARAALAAAGPGNLGALRAALVAAAGLGVPGAFPASRHDTGQAARGALAAAAAGVAGELDARLAAADTAAAQREALRALLGRGLPVLPRFRPALPELLGPALATEPDLGPEPDATVEGWLAQLARVRAPVDAWRELRLLARALGRRIPRPRIVQLPLERDPHPARWAALAFGAEADRPRSGLVSLALVGAEVPAAGQPWAGLLLDTWPEPLPSREEDAAVVFQYDAPRAEAPQALLLAVPPAAPQPGSAWSYDALERTLLGTLELARGRAVDLDHLGPHAQLLPLTFLAANRANMAVSTSFAGLLVRDAVIRQEG
jgi:hypothetical protein